MATNVVQDICKLLKISSPKVLQWYQLSNTVVENSLLYGESYISITGTAGISKMPESTLHKYPLVRLCVKITTHLKWVKTLEATAFSQDAHDKNFVSRLMITVIYKMPHFFQSNDFTSLPMNKKLLSKTEEINESTRWHLKLHIFLTLDEQSKKEDKFLRRNVIAVLDNRE